MLNLTTWIFKGVYRTPVDGILDAITTTNMLDAITTTNTLDAITTTNTHTKN